MDPYVYPGTSILVNRAEICRQPDADRFERIRSGIRASELDFMGITGRFDPEHVRSIHRFLFQDVWSWAGEYRSIGIWKGNTEFSKPENIAGDLVQLCGDIQRNGYFPDCSEDALADGLAQTFARLNQIHPFREGNGRCERIFVVQLAANAGYDLSFDRVTDNDLRNPAESFRRGDLRLMRYLMRSNMTKLEDYAGPAVVSEKPPVSAGRASAAGGKPAPAVEPERPVKRLFGLLRRERGRDGGMRERTPAD